MSRSCSQHKIKQNLQNESSRCSTWGYTGTYMIGAHKARFFPTSKGKKRGMMPTYIVKGMNITIVTPAYHILYISQPGTLQYLGTFKLPRYTPIHAWLKKKKEQCQVHKKYLPVKKLPDSFIWSVHPNNNDQKLQIIKCSIKNQYAKANQIPMSANIIQFCHM